MANRQKKAFPAVILSILDDRLVFLLKKKNPINS